MAETASPSAAAPEAPSRDHNPNRIVNDGKGVTVEQAAEAFDMAGIVDQLDELEKSSPNGGRRAPDAGTPEEVDDLKRAIEDINEQGSSPETGGQVSPRPATPPGGEPAYSPPPSAAPIPQQAQRAINEIQSLGQAYNQLSAALDSLNANRAALAQQFGPATVLAEEQKLRYQIDQVNQAGVRARQGLDYWAAQQKQQQQQAAQQEMESRNARFRREFQTDVAGLADLARESIAWAVDQGVPRDRVMNCSEDEARVLMQATLDRRSAQQARQAAERAAQKVKQARALARARPDPNKPIYTSHGVYRPGDGSLAEAADKFMKLGVC